LIHPQKKRVERKTRRRNKQVGLINQAPTLMGEKDLVPFEFKEGSDMMPVKKTGRLHKY
jgi:hypothetical protein